MRRGATARLFAAVALPGAVCDELSAWARSAVRAARMPAGARVLDDGSLHLTLCFLGNRPVAEIDALADALGACAEHACELCVGAPLWLPPRRPRALAVEIAERGGELARLQAELSAALAQAGTWVPERRRFRAHVTVARMRGGERGPARPARPARPAQPVLPATPPLRFVAPSVGLYRSWLAPAGASYECIASRALAPGAPG